MYYGIISHYNNSIPSVWSLSDTPEQLAETAAGRNQSAIKRSSGCKHSIKDLSVGHVTGYQPIRDQYFLVRSVPVVEVLGTGDNLSIFIDIEPKISISIRYISNRYRIEK